MFKSGDKVKRWSVLSHGKVVHGGVYTVAHRVGSSWIKLIDDGGEFTYAAASFQLHLPAPTYAPNLPKESDPTGRDLNSPGAKADAGKPRPALVLGGFARALLAVTDVGTGGAAKYTDNGWQEVPNGVDRYDDAGLRHWLKEKAGQLRDTDTNLLHAAHDAWNALARLDLLIREQEKTDANKA